MRKPTVYEALVCEACGCNERCGLADYEPPAVLLRAWLDKQHCKPGGVSKEARELLETVIADLEAGEF